MKKIVVLIRLKTIIMILGLIILIAVFGSIFCMGMNTIRTNAQFSDELDRILNENEKLRDKLQNITLEETRVLYDEKYRNMFKYTPSSKPKSIEKVLEKGYEISFKKTYNNVQYKRPVYDSRWVNIYFRGWLYLPRKLSLARHKVFVYYGGASNIYDFVGELGLHEGASIDYHRNINFLIYNFNVKNIKKLDYQIILIGEPKRTGVQIVAVKIDDVLPQEKETANFFFQLVTPGGYEIDYFVGPYSRSKYVDNLKDLIPAKEVFNFAQGHEPMKVLLEKRRQENKMLKDKLSKYVPLEEDFITTQECRVSSKINIQTENIKTAVENGKQIKFKTNYSNYEYKRPIYHPIWQKNYDIGWCFIPQKICESFHKLFIIPKESNRQIEFFNSIAFFENYLEIKEKETGFLIYDFDVSKVIYYNNQIIILGKPIRNKAEIISIDNYDLDTNSHYVVRLVSPDYYEMDYDVLKVLK